MKTDRLKLVLLMGVILVQATVIIGMARNYRTLAKITEDWRDAAEKWQASSVKWEDAARQFRKAAEKCMGVSSEYKWDGVSRTGTVEGGAVNLPSNWPVGEVVKQGRITSLDTGGPPDDGSPLTSSGKVK